MTEIEMYINKFPEYKFYGVEVEHPLYYGEVNKINGKVIIYVNTLQPEWRQLNTIVHEAGHAEFNMYGDDNRWSINTMLAEKQAEYVAKHFVI
ncbi:ImmA/IrrE family metallo-endopeptidase [Leuconostoc miyukkimchii]|uniref:ImmA/IrrE family metallo-endopeptidase n=1 Tax=Leuconostoc miyukkimchii TaxID=910540 RepID=UPI001C7DCB35|nr:ImmA/IrrE family metallo-endopeptidase [Leuconostoc miyukkimchii]